MKIFLPGASSPCGPGVPSSQGNRETLCRWTELHQGISWFDFLKREEYYGTIAAKLSKTFCWWFVSDHKEYVFFDSSWGSLQRSARVLSERRVRYLEFMWFMLMFQCDSSWSRGDIFYLFESCFVSLVIYDKMGKIVLDDIRDKFKRPEEVRLQVWGFDVFLPSRFGPRRSQRSQKSPSKMQVPTPKRLGIFGRDASKIPLNDIRTGCKAMQSLRHHRYFSTTRKVGLINWVRLRLQKHHCEHSAASQLQRTCMNLLYLLQPFLPSSSPSSSSCHHVLDFRMAFFGDFYGSFGGHDARLWWSIYSLHCLKLSSKQFLSDIYITFDIRPILFRNLSRN